MQINVDNFIKFVLKSLHFFSRYYLFIDKRMENYHSLNEYKNINNIKLNLKFVVFLRTSIGLLKI